MVGDTTWRKLQKLPLGLLQHVLDVPAVRPHVVDRARQRLATHVLPPPARVVAASVVDVLVAERRR